jgi:hypothetical protein
LASTVLLAVSSYNPVDARAIKVADKCALQHAINAANQIGALGLLNIWLSYGGQNVTKANHL